MLVILLGCIKSPGRCDLGDNGITERLVPLQGLFGSLGKLALYIVFIKDGGTVLMTFIAELAVIYGRVDIMPEYVQEKLVAKLVRVVDYLYRLGMAGTAGRHLFVGRIRLMPTRIADRHRDDPRQLVERGLHAPETTTGKDGNLLFRLAGVCNCQYQQTGDRGHK
jgi:hypothetical protein